MLANIPATYKRLTRGQYIGILLAVLSLLAGFLLVANSAWFITATALTGMGVLGVQGYNIFLPSACIRFLALAKPLNVYKEKIYNHKVTLDKLTSSRAWIFDKILKLKKYKLVEFRSSQLLNELINDIEAMDHFYLGMVLPWVSAGILFLMAVTFSIFILPVMLWIIVTVFVIAGVVIPILTYVYCRRHEEGSLFLKRQSNTDLIALLRGFADLRQFGLIDGKSELVSKEINIEQNLRSKSKRELAFWQSVQQIILQAGLIISILVLFTNISKINGPILVLTLISMITLFEALLPFPALSHRFSRTTWCGNSLNQWQYADDPHAATGTLSFPTLHDIQIDDITSFYGLRNIFSNLSFKFREGCIIVITGCNGCGKTTLLDILCGMRLPIQGSISIGEKCLADIDPGELVNNIAYMEQQATIFNISLFENIAMAKEGATEPEVLNAAVQAGLGTELSQNPGFLSSIAGESGKNISGGQARMIALARIILKDSPVLLMDEPTEGLDINAERNLIDLLSSWRGRKTIILVTHKNSLISIADQQLNLQ